MKNVKIWILFAAAYLAIFWSARFDGLRAIFEAQIDFLPALMVYAALSANLWTLAGLAAFGGIGFDALSANPLGISVLPLFLVGYFIFLKRELILRDEIFAQCFLGGLASAAAPALTLIFLFSVGEKPMTGVGTLWQWLVMSAGGAIATPILFWFFDRLNRELNYAPIPEPIFRADREIKRGRI
jgi:rod shape-determining protein MreD